MNRMAAARPNLTDQTRSRAQEVLSGKRRDMRALLSVAGPAVVASIAYLDPGNVVTNIQAGARYGDTLLWVVLLASGIAMLFQSMSAKLGIVTGRNLAELCRDSLPRRHAMVLWVFCELAAMATDVAEVLGSAIGISLLFDLSLIEGALITAAATYGLLQFEKLGFRPLELIIGALIGIIGLSYLIELWIVPVHWGSIARHSLPSRFTDHGALTIAVGIVGATIMPHTLFLHSGLTQSRLTACAERERTMLIRLSNIEVAGALSLAGLINVAMVIIASGAFHRWHREIADIASASKVLTPLFGALAGSVFLLALIASGIASSIVGTMAGQVIAQGFVGFRIPLWLRRLGTIMPAFVVIASGMDVTKAMIASQVILSIALPVPMIALVCFTSHRGLMGSHRNHWLMTATAITATAFVLGLNVALLWQLVRG